MPSSRSSSKRFGPLGSTGANREKRGRGRGAGGGGAAEGGGQLGFDGAEGPTAGRNDHGQVGARLQIIEKHKHHLDADKYSVVWEALALPGTIDEASAARRESIKVEEARYMEELKEARERFRREVRRDKPSAFSFPTETPPLPPPSFVPPPCLLFPPPPSKFSFALFVHPPSRFYRSAGVDGCPSLICPAGQVVVLAEEVSKWHTMDDEDEASLYAIEVSKLAEVIQSHRKEAQVINRREALIRWEKTDYKQIEDLQKQLLPYVDLWALVSSFQAWTARWRYGPLFAFSLEQLDKQARTLPLPSLLLPYPSLDSPTSPLRRKPWPSRIRSISRG